MTSRSEAIAAGLLRYDGIPCKYGHTLRYVSNHDCIVCKRLAKYKRRDELRKIKREEKQKLKASPEYIEAKRIARQEYGRKFHAEYWSRPENKYKLIKKRAYQAQWRQDNKAKRVEALRRRRAGKTSRTPKWLTELDIWVMREIYDLAIKRTALTGVKWHVDHILPLHGKTVSGLHVPSNLQVIPATLNLRKGTKLLEGTYTPIKNESV